MTPTVTHISRTTINDVVVSGYLIPKGTDVLVDHRHMVRNGEYWNGQVDLMEFNPDRWNEQTPPKASYVPFGFGGRMCPGRKMADNYKQ